MTGTALWDFFWPYSPTGGIKVIPQLASSWRSFRSTRAPHLGDFWDAAQALQQGRRQLSSGERSLIATAHLFYRDSSEAVREWTRRRHQRFAAALSAAAGIALGIVIGRTLFPVDSEERQLLEVLLMGVAVVTVLFGLEAHQQAEQMEDYWFVLRDRGLDRDLRAQS